MISTRQKMLDLIKQRDRAKDNSAMATTYERITGDQAAASSLDADKDYMGLVGRFMKENPDASKAEAMRQTTRKYPEAHQRWLDSVQG